MRFSGRFTGTIIGLGVRLVRRISSWWRRLSLRRLKRLLKRLISDLKLLAGLGFIPILFLWVIAMLVSDALKGRVKHGFSKAEV